jgi:UPF0042 nucleotide-binding protein
MTAPNAPAQTLVLVTGLSGAGRTTAIAALEDLGYEAIDRMPLALIPRLFEGEPLPSPLALGVDAKTRGFSASGLAELVAAFARDPRIAMEVLYLDCTPDTLLRRYSETRRRHPAAPAEHPRDGIQREIDLLAPIRDAADTVLDTTELTPHELRAEMARMFGTGARGGGLSISIQSFSYRRGLPAGADLVFDCRFLRNPHWEPSLRAQDGRTPAIGDHIAADPRLEPFFTKIQDLVVFLLPAHKDEGKSHLGIAFGCTGGKHRSVYMAERLAKTLAEGGWRVSKRHRELERAASSGLPSTGLETG